MNSVQVYIFTGCSGSGKHTAASALEDEGFYCVQNMPAVLLPRFFSLPSLDEWGSRGYVFVMDLREKGYSESLAELLAWLRKRGYEVQVIFLEADEESLISRYSETRRIHPAPVKGTLLEKIRFEQKSLGPVRAVADKIIDTSRYTVHDLKKIIRNLAKGEDVRSPLHVEILSFGYKFGLPRHADLIVDVRCLINPYFIPDLREKNGLNKSVRDYVLNDSQSKKFIKKYMEFLTFVLPCYQSEGKAYLTIAVGCTGGRHRSVAVAETLVEILDQTWDTAMVRHRDIEK